MSQATPCRCLTEETPPGWNTWGFDDRLWARASEFTDERVSVCSYYRFTHICSHQVGWGKPPQQGDGLINPRDVDWGNSSFIWGPDLDLHNRVLFRYSTCKPAKNETETWSWMSFLSSFFY